MIIIYARYWESRENEAKDGAVATATMAVRVEVDGSIMLNSNSDIVIGCYQSRPAAEARELKVEHSRLKSNRINLKSRTEQKGRRQLLSCSRTDK